MHTVRLQALGNDPVNHTLAPVPVCCVHIQVGSGQLRRGDPGGEGGARYPFGPLEQSRLHADPGFAIQL